MLQDSLTQHKWKSILLKSQPLNINHLTFANIIWFSHATEDGLQEILNILHQFSLASGQRVNVAKSHLIFNNKASNHFKHHVCSVLNMPCLGDTCMYLGIPFSHARV